MPIGPKTALAVWRSRNFFYCTRQRLLKSSCRFSRDCCVVSCLRSTPASKHEVGRASEPPVLGRRRKTSPVVGGSWPDRVFRTSIFTASSGDGADELARRRRLMGTSVSGTGAFRGGGRAGTALVLALGLVLAVGAHASAGDVSAQPSGGLSVTGSSLNALPQTSGATAENSWLSGLHVSGYLSQTFGMWQNPTALRMFTPSRNNLATSRTLLQVDENYRLNDDNTFFMREWFVYEPPYAFNSANGLGMYGNEFYNQYTVRDAWWENKTGPLTTYVGNQIVVWGQSLAFRVGDVINPQDTTWAFGFANLEQSRIPQWMIHPILNLPEFGPFTSNFLEGVIIPRFQPMWNSCDYADHRYDGECMTNAGTVNNGFPAGVGFDPTGRFGAHIASTYFTPMNTAVIGPRTPPYIPPGLPMQFSRIVGSPLANPFYACSNFIGAPFNFGKQPGSRGRYPAALTRPCALAGNSALDVLTPWNIPASNLAN